MKRRKRNGEFYKYLDEPDNEDLPRLEGKYFIRYREKYLLKNGFFREEWMSKEQLKKGNSYRKKRRGKKGIKELNPKTGNPWIKGEYCDERGFFYQYGTETKNDGYLTTHFCKNFDTYHRRRISSILEGRKIVSKKKNIPFNITLDELCEIFPKNFKCPILGIDIEWSNETTSDNNPSLDRIIPEKGYTKNNVKWVSYRGNSIKSDITYEELLKLIRFFKKITEVII